MMELDYYKMFAEFGIVGGLLLGLSFFAVVALRWLAINAIKPLVIAGIDYLSMQTKSTAKNLEAIENLTLLEGEIRTAILEMKEAHTDSDSKFATVHTNMSISILARAVGRIAKAIDVDVHDLINELQTVLNRQAI